METRSREGTWPVWPINYTRPRLTPEDVGQCSAWPAATLDNGYEWYNSAGAGAQHEYLSQDTEHGEMHSTVDSLTPVCCRVQPASARAKEACPSKQNRTSLTILHISAAIAHLPPPVFSPLFNCPALRLFRLGPPRSRVIIQASRSASPRV